MLIRWVIFPLFLCLGICLEDRWFKIFLEKDITWNYLTKTLVISPEMSQFQLIQMASQIKSGRLACITTSTTLIVNAGRISPLYKNQTSDTLTCFTKLPKDLVFGSQISGTKVYAVGGSGRNEMNLIKGLYVGRTDRCCIYETSSQPLWLLVDFGSPRRFSSVAMTAATTSNLDYLIKAGDIWIGNSSVSNGDFSGYRRFSSFPDFASSETKEIKKTNSVTARFVG